MDLRDCLVTLIAASVAATSAGAQTVPSQPTGQSTPAKNAKDPNELVCERQEDLGSRLATTKVCHTRAEWADLRHQDRQMLDQAQTLRGTRNGH